MGHLNAKLTAKGRLQMVLRVVEGAHSPKAVATAFGLCAKSVRKWVARFRNGGAAALADRTSRPQRLRAVTPSEKIEQVRLLRLARCTGVHIARTTGLSTATVCRILSRIGLKQLPPLQPPSPVVRYEHEHPGDLLHMDIKKLARIARVGHRVTGNPRDETRGAGWEFAHMCVDDHTRIAFAGIWPDEKRESAIECLEAAASYYSSLGFKLKRVMTDNGSCYRSAAFRKACSKLGVRHIFTKPYTPRTNGKVERFIKSGLREWAYARPYVNSEARTIALQTWIHLYNHHRPHRSLQNRPPISRLKGDNVLTPYIYPRKTFGRALAFVAG
jgi:transposase InsO family protein